jgi:FkbM family methyltransferase
MSDAIDERDSGDDLDTKYLKKEIQVLLHHLQRLTEAARMRLQGELAQALIERTAAVDTPRGTLSLVALGRTSAGRAASLLTKQPATIAWIDAFQPGSVFWDVGANIGVYTLYAALRGDTQVVAFEPAAVNYYMLAANCEVNRFDDRVRCLLAGLGRRPEIADLAVSQFAAAASFGFGGKKAQVFSGRQAAVILTIDQLVEDYGVPCPNYIKIDVPGLSEDILAGGERTLRRPEVREVHIEARDTSSGGRRIVETLARSGLDVAGSSMHGSSDITFVRTRS